MAEQHADYTVADAGLNPHATDSPRVDGFHNGGEHLRAELKRLDWMLQLEVSQLRAARLLTEDAFRGLYIPDAQIDALLSRGDAATQPSANDASAAQTLAALVEQTRQENEARVQSALRAGVDLPLPRLAALFNLTAFEAGVVLLCLAPEVELKYETFYAYVQNDVTKKHPSIDLALRLLCTTYEERIAAREVFAADGALARHQLVRVFTDAQERESPLLARFIRLEQRVADFLLGGEKLESRLMPFTRRVVPVRQLRELLLPGELQARLSNAAQSFTERGGVFYFSGSYGVGKQAAAEAFCFEQRMPLLVVDLRRAVATEQDFALLAALLRREATLQNAALYLKHFEVLLAEDTQTINRRLALARELSGSTLPVMLGSEASWYPTGLWGETLFLEFEFPLPPFALRRQLWERAMHEKRDRLSPDVDFSALANKFVLSGGQIEDAVREVEHLAALRPPDERAITMDDLHAAARDQSNQGLRRLAQKIEPVYVWTDIVLPPRALQQLREVCVSVKHRHTVYSSWGFDRKLSLGRGINVLFSGTSGTGKTMAAQVIANELSLDIYKIDLSSVVSKYIGETEKNLDKIFHEAKSSNAILFFDEADALFGKRSEVKDAHDRYANIEVAYLLQKMEEYEGVVILATNLSKNLDDAFTRRMHHTVEFPFPDVTHRERIWRRLFPEEAPLAENVDFGFLARQFDFAGGNIRNVALAAAFMAAEEGGHIRMEHLILATARELQKIGKLPSKSDFREYYELIRERG